MKDHLSGDEHRRTLAWLDDSLKWARPRDRTRLVKLLDLVRTEVLFEISTCEDPRTFRHRSSRVGLTPNPNRAV